MSVDLLAAVLEACERTPDAAAITSGGETVSYGEVRRRILSVAGALQAQGFEPGDRVLFSVRPNLDGIALALGVILAGGTIVFADPGAGESMFRARAELAAPRWVAAESLLYFVSTTPLRPIARSRGLELPPYSQVVPDARHIVAGRWLPGVPRGALRLRDLLTGPAGVAAGDPAAEALVIFTSGTTADPKAVVHSRLSLGTGLAGYSQHVRFAPGERVVTDQLMIGIPALIAGAHWLLPPHGSNPGARPEAYLDLLPEADVLFAVPSALDAILTLLESKPEKTPKLRALLLGGAPVLRPLLDRVAAQLPGTQVLAIYGMTEMLPVAIADGADKLAFTDAGDYVGELLDSVVARIDDQGELVLSGDGLALGFLGHPPLTEVRSGDLGRIEVDGDTGARRLILSGRSKDMFIRGVTNVYPGLYEPVIAGLPGVLDVAMVGVANSFGDDAIVLVVVPSAGTPGLSRDHAAIAPIRRALPGLIDATVLPDEILVIDRMPRSGRSHKLDRKTLAACVTAFLATARP
ncbi:MAG: class I adenylate-forming enzyme family protein [Microbacteriaceae bacterium]